MQNSFEDYIKQLQELESAENVVTMKALRDMNENSLKFFPVIWKSINQMIDTNSVTFDVVQDIKEHLPVLSKCKRNYDELSKVQRSKYHSTKITKLLSLKNSLTIQEAKSYESELEEMLRMNEAKLLEEKTKKIEKEVEPTPVIDPEVLKYEPIYLSGTDIPIAKRLLLAKESANKEVIRKLKRSKSISILETLLQNKYLKEKERVFIKNRIENVKNQPKPTRPPKKEGGCLGCLASITIFLGTIVGGGVFCFMYLLSYCQ